MIESGSGRAAHVLYLHSNDLGFWFFVGQRSLWLALEVKSRHIHQMQRS